MSGALAARGPLAAPVRPRAGGQPRHNRVVPLNTIPVARGAQGGFTSPGGPAVLRMSISVGDGDGQLQDGSVGNTLLREGRRGSVELHHLQRSEEAARLLSPRGSTGVAPPSTSYEASRAAPHAVAVAAAAAPPPYSFDARSLGAGVRTVGDQSGGRPAAPPRAAGPTDSAGAALAGRRAATLEATNERAREGSLLVRQPVPPDGGSTSSSLRAVAADGTESSVRGNPSPGAPALSRELRAPGGRTPALNGSSSTVAAVDEGELSHHHPGRASDPHDEGLAIAASLPTIASPRQPVFLRRAAATIIRGSSSTEDGEGPVALLSASSRSLYDTRVSGVSAVTAGPHHAPSLTPSSPIASSSPLVAAGGAASLAKLATVSIFSSSTVYPPWDSRDVAVSPTHADDLPWDEEGPDDSRGGSSSGGGGRRASWELQLSAAGSGGGRGTTTRPRAASRPPPPAQPAASAWRSSGRGSDGTGRGRRGSRGSSGGGSEGDSAAEARATAGGRFEECDEDSVGGALGGSPWPPGSPLSPGGSLRSPDAVDAPCADAGGAPSSRTPWRLASNPALAVSSASTISLAGSSPTRSPGAPGSAPCDEGGLTGVCKPGKRITWSDHHGLALFEVRWPPARVACPLPCARCHVATAAHVDPPPPHPLPPPPVQIHYSDRLHYSYVTYPWHDGVYECVPIMSACASWWCSCL